MLASGSWRIEIGPSFFLNPPLFIREVCGLSLPGDAFRGKAPWPPAYLAERLTPAERSAARCAWAGWWTDMLALSRAAAGSAAAGNGPATETRRAFDPPGFSSLQQHPELRKACQAAWGPYIHWWQMPAGGNRALEAAAADAGVQRVVREFEKRHRRRARSFSLDIALVYPETEEVHDAGEGFAVLGSRVFHGHRFETWLTARLETIA